MNTEPLFSGVLIRRRNLRPVGRVGQAERPRENISQLTLGPIQRGRQINSAACIHPAQEGDVAAIRRPRRGGIRGRVRGQPQGGSHGDELDVDVVIVLALSVPYECNLITVGREGRETLTALECSERDYLWIGTCRPVPC